MRLAGANWRLLACSATSVMVPALVAVTAPSTMKAGPDKTRKVTGRPLLALAASGYARPHTSGVSSTGEIQARVCELLNALKLCSTGLAGRNWSLPACSARTVTVPTPVRVS